MITVHDPAVDSGQTYATTGRGTLDTHLARATVSEELNGAFTLEFSWPVTEPVELAVGDVVACPVPGMPRQGFRITTLETSEGTVTAQGAHITSDIGSNVIIDRAAVNRTGSEALAYLLDSLSAPHPFTAGPTTSVGARMTARWVRKTGLEALIDDEVGLLARWGGEIIRDNTRLSWTPRRGIDGGASVWEGKNLTALTVTRDTSGLATRILPVGFDGLTLPEVFVDSPRLGDYPYPVMRVVKFDAIRAAKDPDKPQEGELPLQEALEALRQASRDMFATGVDLPVLIIDGSMAPDQIGLDQVRIGDTLTVHSSSYGLQATARITGYTFNAMAGVYESLTLETQPGATAARSLAGQVKALSQTAAARAEDTAAAMIGANGSNTVYYQKTEPTGARLGDTWFQDAGEGKIAIWVYQTTSQGTPGWVQVAGDITAAALEAELAQARAQIAKIDTDLSGQITQMGTEFDAAYQGLENELGGKVNASGVIAAINASVEKDLIAGKHLHITGAALIDTAVIKTSMIGDAAITDAKIGSLSASKITTGTLSAARIAAGSITSDKLSIANGYITTAMIKDAAITSAKIGSLDAGKITTGTLNAARIGAGTISADKLASNAIQVGLAGWSSTIRITPTAISWYNGSTLEGQITSQGMSFWYGTRKIGWMGEQYKKDYPNIRGITNALDWQGDFVDWAYLKSSSDSSFTTMLSLDPKGKFWGQSGIHLGTALRTHGWAFYTAGNRSITLQDVVLNGLGTFPGWASSNNLAKIVFHTYDVMVVTNGSYYNMTRLFDRVNDLMGRVNTLISLLNQGWIKTIRDAGGGRVTWEYYSNTGWQTMPTNLT